MRACSLLGHREDDKHLMHIPWQRMSLNLLQNELKILQSFCMHCLRIVLSASMPSCLLSRQLVCNVLGGSLGIMSGLNGSEVFSPGVATRLAPGAWIKRMQPSRST